jgi:hypothetical protein
MIMWLEAGVAFALVFMAFVCPRFGEGTLDSIERRFVALAHQRKLSVLVVGITALALRVAALPVLPEPQAYINDEFSFLLAADTFAHGRLANPAHPMWIHFETFHVIQQPTYASMYPPAQGLVLALGQAVTGHPFVGVCLSVALMCAAICWMLQGWMGPPWALLGGLLAAMHFGVFSYWADSYWGGAMAALGGSLAMGALPRIRKTLCVGAALLMGIGIAILANSRPYEGMVFCLPVAAAMLAWLVRGPHPPFKLILARAIVPLGIVLALAALATCYYFWRVTGSPFRMPYQVDRSTYAVAPYFMWQSPRPEPVYHHQAIHDFYTHNELDYYLQTRTTKGLVGTIAAKYVNLWIFYVGPLLTVPLLMVIATLPMGFPWRSISQQTRYLLAAAATFCGGLAIEVFFFPHYAAPLTCVIFALLMVCFRRIHRWRWRERPSGKFLVRALPLAFALLLIVRATAGPLHLPITPGWPPNWYNATVVKTDRERMIAQLQSLPGKQLVLVRFAPRSKSLYDWVYNPADIDSAKIVWAMDMGAARNQELINYYKDRQMWLVEPDRNSAQWELYTGKNSH